MYTRIHGATKLYIQQHIIVYYVASLDFVKRWWAKEIVTITSTSKTSDVNWTVFQTEIVPSFYKNDQFYRDTSTLT